jgi:hypothetical protein
MSTDQTGTTNDNQNGVSDYSYVKTGADTGVLVNWNVAPFLSSSAGNVINLTFSSPTSAMFRNTNYNNGVLQVQTGSVSIAATSNNLAPASIAGMTATPSTGGTATFGAGGVFGFVKGAEQDTGTYTYAQYSPVGAMVVITHSDSSTSYVQWTFGSPNYYFETDFDSSTNFNGTSDGTFTLKQE